MSDCAPRGRGRYTSALVAGKLRLRLGQGPLDRETLDVRGTTAGEQTLITPENVVALVEAAGGGRRDIVRCNVYLASMELFDDFAANADFFADAPRPTRTTIGCELTGILVEIDCIADVPRDAV